MVSPDARPTTGARQHLTVRQVADRLGIDANAVRRLIRSGRLPAALLTARTGYRIHEAEVRYFLGEPRPEPIVEEVATPPPTVGAPTPRRRPLTPVRSRKFIPAEVRAAVWDKTSGTCWYCRKTMHPFRDFTVDHVVPFAKGGSDDFDNLVPCCWPCNNRKGAREGWIAA